MVRSSSLRSSLSQSGILSFQICNNINNNSAVSPTTARKIKEEPSPRDTVLFRLPSSYEFNQPKLSQKQSYLTPPNSSEKKERALSKKFSKLYTEQGRNYTAIMLP